MCIGGSRKGALRLHTVFEKFWQNIMLMPPPPKYPLLPKNPGSAPDLSANICKAENLTEQCIYILVTKGVTYDI